MDHHTFAWARWAYFGWTLSSSRDVLTRLASTPVTLLGALLAIVAHANHVPPSMYGHISAAIAQRGEAYRLFTSVFLHDDGLHLAFNALAWATVSHDQERAMGSSPFLTHALVLLVAAGVGVTVVHDASRTFLPCDATLSVWRDQTSIGASAVIFALESWTVARSGTSLMDVAKSIASDLLIAAMMFPDADHLAHAVGAAAGVAHASFPTATVPLVVAASAFYCRARILDTLHALQQWIQPPRSPRSLRSLRYPSRSNDHGGMSGGMSGGAEEVNDQTPPSRQTLADAAQLRITRAASRGRRADERRRT